MKKNLFLSLFSLIVLTGSAAFACSPPPYVLSIQGGQLDRIIHSDEVQKKILEIGSQGTGYNYNRGIKSITYSSGTYIIETLDDCSFEVKVEYTLPPTPGMCPSISGLSLSKGECK